ncbi:hypothetical protein HDV03_001361 [Kappamyces sp. JEL0829]|nr:hypothetical protein HDV03_001361 [Kappamyces sp. JEL0829]
MPLSEKSERIVWVLTLLALAVLAPVLGYLNTQTSITKTMALSTGTVNPQSPPSEFNGVSIMANVTAIDPLSQMCRVRFLFIPVGSWAKSGPADLTLSKPALFVAGSSRTLLTPEMLMPAIEVNFDLSDGNPVYYPFDSYSCEFVLGLYDTNSTAFSTSATLSGIPLAVGLIGGKQSWSAVSDVLDLDRTHLYVSLTFFRSWMTKLYSTFIVSAMWVLTACLLKITWDIWWEDRVAESATMRLGVRFLFAFPALRYAQPGLPVMGCTEDVASFFWCILFAAVCSILLLSNFMRYNIFHDHEKSAPIWPPRGTSTWEDWF